MRQISTHTSAEDAERFASYLKQRSFDVVAEQDPQGDTWSLWARDEDQIAAVEQEYKAFRENPLSPIYNVAVPLPESAREPTSRNNRVRVRRPRGPRPLTWTLFGLYFLVQIMQSAVVYHPGNTVMRALSLRDPTRPLTGDGQAEVFSNVAAGELWRLVTPVFLHTSGASGFLGIFLFAASFFLLLTLGSQAERRIKTRRFALLVLFISLCATISHGLFAEKVLDAAMPWGGILSISYGLFGFNSVAAMQAPDAGLQPPRVVVMLMLSFIISGAFFPQYQLALWPHVVGLLSGVVCGYLPFGQLVEASEPREEEELT